MHNRPELDPHRYRSLSPRPPDGPLVLGELLPGTGEIEIEVGFGHGRFLFERAVARPDVRILGLEIKKKWAYLVAERCRARGLHHVTAWGADARDVLSRVPEASVARVFMHFPDPWWKRKHEKRRLTGDSLIEEVARVLRPGGEFFMQTDVQERAEVHCAAVRGCAAFVLAGEGGYLAENPYQARSNREARAAEDGLPVFRVLALRRQLGA
jgi:tRNA (guanine-N7-)-methyltransferase